MTQEEKAKAYDEALERARKIHSEIINNEIIGFPGQIEDIFPELRESEDERILASIADCVGFMGEDGDVFSNHNVTKVLVLSWLEKYKESLHISESCKENTDSFMDACKDVIIAIEKYLDWLTGYPDYAPKGKYSIRDMLNCLNLLEKQKEQSITTNDLDEEIHRFFDDCIDVHEAKLYGSISEKVIPVDCYEITARHFAKWGEKQKEEEGYEAIPVESTLEYKLGFKAGKDFERQKEQKPSEWSEDDERNKDRAVFYARYYQRTEAETKGSEECINWLKSFPLNIKKEKEQDKCPEYCVRSHCLGCSIYEKQKEQKPNYCHYGGDPSIERCRYCSAVCSGRLTEEQKPAPKFRVGDVMRTKQEAAEGITDGLPVVVSIDEDDYICNNETISITDQEEYEFPPMNTEQKPADLPPGFYFIDLDGKKYYSKEFRFGDMKMKIVEDKSGKPAEWSEEDEKMIELIRAIVFGTGKVSNGVRTEILDWLKSLRPSWKPSKNEERLINTSISFLKDFADKGYENAVECIDWLKSKLNGNSCK